MTELQPQPGKKAITESDQITETGRLRRRKFFTMLGTVIGLAALVWLFWGLRLGGLIYLGTSCPVNTSGQAVAKAPTITSSVERPVNYPQRWDNSYVPAVLSHPQKIEGHTYSTNIACDEPTISPYPGARLNCRLFLLKDGGQINKMPLTKSGQPIFSEINLYLAVTDAFSVKEGSSFKTTPKTSLIPATNQISFVDVLTGASQIVVPSRFTESIKRTSYDSNGEAVGTETVQELKFTGEPISFQYIQNGFHASSTLAGNIAPPYVEIVAAAYREQSRTFSNGATSLSPFDPKNTRGIVTDGVVSSNRITCFSDITNRAVDKSAPTNRFGDAVQYDVKFSPTAVADGKNTIVKITVTAKNPKTHLTNTNQYQRVALALTTPADLQSAHAGTTLDPGHFIGSSDSLDPTIAKTSAYYNVQQVPVPTVTDHPEVYYKAGVLDLVKGSGTAYYSFTGDFQTLVAGHNGPYLYFVAHPVSYEYLGEPDPRAKSPAYRTQAKITIPKAPTDNPIRYLYGGTWYDASCTSSNWTSWDMTGPCVNPLHGNFTATGLTMVPFSPFGQPAKPFNWLIWFEAVQLTQIVLGGLLIAVNKWRAKKIGATTLASK